MPTDAELTFADHTGRFYARRYGYPPMVGRLLGYLMVCGEAEQSINELSEALLASRSAITGALKMLEQLDVVRRTRAAGERMDRIRLDISSPRSQGFDNTEYEELRDLAHEGLRLLEDAPAERRAALLETAALAEFLVERIPTLHKEWLDHRDALRAAGKLPETQSRGRG